MSPELFSCKEAHSRLLEITSLKDNFERAYEEAMQTGDLANAKRQRLLLEEKITSLREAVFPLEREFGLKNQYESQRNILEESGILERLSSGELGIHGIDGKEYSMPSYREIAQRMREKKEILMQKKEQGFVKLLIVPFGMSLDSLLQEYGNLLIKHHNEGKLFATKERVDNESEEFLPLDLDVDNPVWCWSAYANADSNGKLVYDPKEFSGNHGGKKKSEILAAMAPSALSPAWRILILEANPNIPRENEGEELGARKQLEANRTPNQYLQDIGNGVYAHESGMTPEDWLTYAITMLEEKNQVIDDYQGKGSIAYNTGAYFVSGGLPHASWRRDYRQAVLGGDDPTDRGVRIGARFAVRV